MHVCIRSHFGHRLVSHNAGVGLAICSRLCLAMAPKKRASVGASSAPSAKKAKASPCAPGTSLVVKDETDLARASALASSDDKPKESLDNKVARCIRDNFKGWTYHKTDFTVRNGMSLREKIRHDKERQDGGDKSLQFGKHYFAELRQQYGSATDPDQLINVKNDEELIDNKLQDALEGLFDRSKDYQTCIAMLDQMCLCNQKSLVVES